MKVMKVLNGRLCYILAAMGFLNAALFYTTVIPLLIFKSSVTPLRKNAGLGTRSFPLRYITYFYVLKEERYVLFRSFLEFLATYGTQKNVTFFPVLLQRTEKNARTFRSFAKRTGERYVLISRYI